MNDKPASAPDVVPPHEPPKSPAPDDNPEGTNETIHQPDPKADEHRVRPDGKPRGPYTTGNW